MAAGVPKHIYKQEEKHKISKYPLNAVQAHENGSETTGQLPAPGRLIGSNHEVKNSQFPVKRPGAPKR